MGFFDSESSYDPRRDRPVEQQAGPARLGPPSGWVLPTVLPTVRVLGQSDNVRIALVGVRCWPEGVTLGLSVLRRWAPPPARTGLGFPPRDNPDDWAFRFGLRFADGKVAIAPRRPAPPRTAADANGVVLRQQSGGGDQYFRHYDFYLWPLPPRGRLTLVLDWPAEKVPETHTELDAGQLREGAARAQVVWADLPAPSPDAVNRLSRSVSFGTSGGSGAAVARRRSAHDRDS
jgi:hypothetical protein